MKLTFESPLEIVSGFGNIAMIDGDLIVHAHVVLADRDGRCYCGHLMEGSRVFSCEVYLRDLSPTAQRKYDETTGLNLLSI